MTSGRRMHMQTLNFNWLEIALECMHCAELIYVDAISSH